MLVNPGGPGGSGLFSPCSARSCLEARRELRLDRVRPARGRLQRAVAELHPRLRRLRPARTTSRPRQSLEHAWLERSKQLRRGLRKNNGCVAARPPEDDGLGQGHGQHPGRPSAQQQINYYGFSYGTYLGQVYGTLFPSGSAGWSSTATSIRARSGTTPTSTRTWRSTSNINIYFKWVAEVRRVFHLGTDREAVEKPVLPSWPSWTPTRPAARSGRMSGPTSSWVRATTSTDWEESPRRSPTGSDNGDQPRPTS